MTAIIFYFVVSTIIVFIGYILYRIFLYKETDFRNVRYYLLLVIIGSLVLPIVNFELPLSLINIFQLAQEANLQNIDSNFSIWPLRNEMPLADSINYLQIIAVVYYSVVFLLCSRMLFQISSLVSCIRRSKKLKNKDHTLVFNNDFNGTFSFFRWVFVSEDMEHTEEMDVIIAHEVAHCRQRHSIDVILAEIIAILFWFNPLIWKLKKAIKLNHEYLADQSVLHSGIIQSAEYQMILLNRAAEGNLFSYGSSFTGNTLKNRILMLLSIKNNAKGFKYKVISILLCCILLVLLTTGFINVKNNAAKDQQAKTKNIDSFSKPSVKKQQDRADEPIIVQSIPIKHVKANIKTSEPNQITVEDKKRTK